MTAQSDKPSAGASDLGENRRTVPNEVIDDNCLTSFDPDADAIDHYKSVEGMRIAVE